jgi:hypothetical protein
MLIRVVSDESALVRVETEVENRVTTDASVLVSVLTEVENRVAIEVSALVRVDSSVLTRVSIEAAALVATFESAGKGGSPLPHKSLAHVLEVNEVNRPRMTSPPTARYVKDDPPSFTMTTVPDALGANHEHGTSSTGNSKLV